MTALEVLECAHVGPNERLVLLLPSTTTRSQIDAMKEQIEALGWPKDRLLLVTGAKGMAVVAESEDE